MKPRVRKRAVLGVLVSLFAISGFAAWSSWHTPWSKSSTEIRAGNPTNDGFWKDDTEPAPLDRPLAPRAFEPITTDRVDDEIWIRRDAYEGPRYHGGEELGARVVREEGGVVSLPGGTQLRLAAAGLFVPGFSERPVFFNPRTLEELSGEQLLGLPGAAQDFEPSPDPSSPTLRLIFDGSATPMVRNAVRRVYDARTQWAVGHGGAIESGEGGAIFADLHLALWHDTPLDVVLDVACGEPVSAPIPREPGAQFLVDEVLRVQIGGLGAGEAKVVGVRGEEFDIGGDRDASGFVIARVSRSIWARQCQIGRVGDPVEARSWLEGLPRFQSAALPAPVDRIAADELRIFWFPDRARVWFRIEGLPGMPNPRSTKNLFDVRIPLVEIDRREDFESLFRHAGQAAQLDVLSDGVYWNYGVGTEPPAGYFPLEMRNVSATGLLREVLRFHAAGEIRIDGEKQYLIYGEREQPQWWEKTKTWIRETWPW